MINAQEKGNGEKVSDKIQKLLDLSGPDHLLGHVSRVISD